MKERRLLIVTLYLVFAFFSLAWAQLSNSGTKEPLTQEAYIEKMTDMVSTMKTVNDGKLVYAGKEASFISKKDSFGNQAAISYYQGLKNTLEGVKKEFLAINPPLQYIETNKLFEEALDNYIAAYGKAIEAHKKDDISIMNNEGAVLLQKAGQSLFQVSQDLKKLKESQQKTY